jgi:hypothetical protein
VRKICRNLTRRTFLTVTALSGAATIAGVLPVRTFGEVYKPKDVEGYCKAATGLIHALTDLPRAIIRIPRDVAKEVLDLLNPKNFVDRHTAVVEKARLLVRKAEMEGKAPSQAAPAAPAPAASSIAVADKAFHDSFSEPFAFNAGLLLDLEEHPRTIRTRVTNYDYRQAEDAELVTLVDLKAPAYQYNGAEMAALFMGLRFEPRKEWIAVDMRMPVVAAQVADSLKQIVDADLVDELLRLYEPAYKRALISGSEMFAARFQKRAPEGNKGYGFVSKIDKNRKAFVLAAHNPKLTAKTIEAVLKIA